MDASILIIGAGTFGTSTAHHLALRGYTNITIIDKHALPSPDSAAHDLNKIIRTEYREPLYTSLALEALASWRNDPLWANILHQTGWLTTVIHGPQGHDKDADDALEELRESYENLKKSGQADGNVEWLDGGDCTRSILRHAPQLQHSRGLQDWKGLFNRQAGWAHAKNALTAMGEAAAKRGVKFVSGPGGTMTGLETNSDNSKVTGIRVASGQVLTADRYILATGAASPALLPELSRQLWSKCWTLAHIQLTEEEAAAFRDMPVVYNHQLGFMFEPDSDNRYIKICNNFPGYQFKTGQYTDKNGRTTEYSVPRYASDHPEDEIPEEAEKEIRRFIDTVLPQFSGRPLEDAKICWCTDSPDSHYLIDTHPAYPGGELLLATGDSGHAFKMLPIIGKYIADAYEGKMKKEWAYGNREDTGNPTRPGDEVKDLRDVGIGVDEATNKKRTVCTLQ